ncbi:MAG: H/ACA ribonucleoprotein complex subunit GAR1 [Nitrososphaeraceae archaeon]
MNELGEILHVAKSGQVIVRLSSHASDKKASGLTVLDINGRQIGKILEIFGPVRSPYASVLPSRQKLTGIVGTKVFVADDGTFRNTRLSRSFPHRPNDKPANRRRHRRIKR